MYNHKTISPQVWLQNFILFNTFDTVVKEKIATAFTCQVYEESLNGNNKITF